MRRASWSREEVIEKVQAYRRETGRAPTTKDFGRGKDNGLPSMKTLLRLWGRGQTVPRLLEDAGVKPRRRPPTYWSKQSIAESIQAFAAKHGRQPTRADADNFYRGELPCSSTVCHHFDTWNAAIEAAGFTPKKGGREAGVPVGAVPRTFEVGQHAAQLDMTPVELIGLAQRLAAALNCDLAEAEDALQEAWISFAHARITVVGDPRGWLFARAKKTVRHERYKRAVRFRQVIEALAEDGGGALAYDIESHLEARLQLAELVERCKPGDDVLRVIADMEREALNLYQPVAQRREVDVLEGLPPGRWLDKLRTAHAAGLIPCLCWEHIREAGITPPPELAQRFPDCHNQRHGTLAKREEKFQSPVMASILDAFEAQGRTAVAA